MPSLPLPFFVSLQLYVLAGHFYMRSRKKVAILIGKMAIPTRVSFMVVILITNFIYPAYNNHIKEGKLLTALFSPFIGVVLKVISRICVQRLCKITHPGYSYVLLAPLYFGLAVVSSFTIGSWPFTIHRYSRNNSRSCRSSGTKHNGCD